MDLRSSYFVYMLANHSHNLYTGITNNLERRIFEHRNGLVPGFTRRYRISRLVHYELFGDIRAAIACEKQIKGWDRKKRIALIESANPAWLDLGESLFSKIVKTSLGRNQLPSGP